MLLSIGYAFMRREALARWERNILLGAVVSHAVSLILRMHVAALNAPGGFYVPWSNWFESFSFFGFVMAAEYLYIQRKDRFPILGSFVTPLIWILMAAALRSPYGTSITPFPPNLKSTWMAIHIPMIFVSYAAFGIAFGIGLAYLLEEHQIKSKKPSHLGFRLPPLDVMDHLIFKIIMFAFPVLTIGLLLGAGWAHQAWDKSKGLDAKVAWSLITWLVYLIYLHFRLLAGWRGRKTTYLSLVGFAVIIFTFIGVNFLSGQHGYLSGGGR